MHILLGFALILFNFAFAETSLLESLQRRNLYDQSCQSELAQLSSKDFELSEIQRYKKPIKDFPLYLGQFYHYSKTNLSHLSNSEIISYTLLKNDNLAGGGFYVSANPISSRTYGNVLNRFIVSPNASFVDLVDLDVSKIVTDFIDSRFNNHPCPKKVLQTIFYQSNGIDLILFERDLDWFVILNDDVMLERSEHTFSPSDMSAHELITIEPEGVVKVIIYYLSSEAIFPIEPVYVERYLDYYAHHEELNTEWLNTRLDWYQLSHETQKTLIERLPFNQRLLDAIINR